MMKAKHRSAAEWEALIATFRRSGLSASAFAVKMGLAPRYFQRKLRRLDGDGERAAFVRIARPMVSPAPLPILIQIGEVRIQATEALSPRWLAEVAAALRA